MSSDRLPSFWRRRLKDVVTTSRVVAGSADRLVLTFDDGPDPEGTPRVLDVLREIGARAVFFVIGSRIPRAPQLLRRMIDEGHVIGNHSHEHAAGRELGFRGYYDDLRRCQATIEMHTGVVPTLFRPPLGEVSMYSLLAPRLLGLTPVLWSIDTGDWRMRCDDDVTPLAARVETQLAGAGLRDIVLLHDERPQTGLLLERLLPALASRGVDLHSGVDTL